MRQKTVPLLNLSLLAALLSTFAAPVWADAREDVAVLMEHVRKHEVVDDTSVITYQPELLLTELKRYKDDPDSGVRLYVLSQVIGITQRYSTQPKIRRQALHFILSVASSDADSSIQGYAAAIPYKFPPYLSEADFTKEMRHEVANLVRQKNPRSEFILLAGVANVQDVRKQLENLTAPGVRGDGWISHLALARMGVKSSIDHVVKEFEAYNVSDTQARINKATILLRDLAYIRQPEAVKILTRYLESDNYLPSSRNESQPGTPYNQYALEYLSEIIEGLPIKTKGLGYSQAEVEKARNWMKANKDKLKIKR